MPFSKIFCAISRCKARRSDCLYSSCQSRPSHFSPSKMDSTLASVLRSTSVSSRRRITVPPVWRAKSQLKMKVRALPTCRKPVGDGAKRTRILVDALTGWRAGRETNFDVTVGGNKASRQAGNAAFTALCLIDETSLFPYSLHLPQGRTSVGYRAFPHTRAATTGQQHAWVVT